MKSITAELLFDTGNTLGEGPLWHPEKSCLYWVDIEAQFLYRSDTALNSYTRTSFDTPIGAFCFTKEGGFLLATGQGFLAWDGLNTQPIWNPLPPRSNVRLNDGKVDPAGRFWAGSIDTEQSQAELYRLDPDGAQHTLLKNLGIANGLDWSPDRKTMYFTDSSQYTIFSFDYYLETGLEISAPSFNCPEPALRSSPMVCAWMRGLPVERSLEWLQVVRYSPRRALLPSDCRPTRDFLLFWW